ncbi:hypothetical protein D3C75_774510 [compost metagenome]
MGADQADKTDGAGQGCSGSAQQNACKCGYHPQNSRADAQPGGYIIAQRQSIQCWGGNNSGQYAKSQKRSEGGDPAPGCRTDAPHLPKPELVHHIRTRNHNCADQGGQCGAGGRSGQNQLNGRGPAASHGAHSEHKNGGNRRSGQSQPDILVGRADIQEGDAADHE